MLNFPISSPKALLNTMGCLGITVMYLRLYKLYLVTNNRSPFKIMSFSTSNSITSLLKGLTIPRTSFHQGKPSLINGEWIQLVFESLKTLKARDQTPNWYSKGKLWFKNSVYSCGSVTKLTNVNDRRCNRKISSKQLQCIQRFSLDCRK